MKLRLLFNIRGNGREGSKVNGVNTGTGCFGCVSCIYDIVEDGDFALVGFFNDGRWVAVARDEDRNFILKAKSDVCL